MLTWLKGLFANPKTLIKIPIDALDYAVPALAAEIAKQDFLKKSPTEQAQFAIDWVQGHLRKLFKIEAE
jgi:hypothetical protein